MKVKALTVIAGPMGTFHPGTIADLPEALARGLIKVNAAEAIDSGEPLPIETTEKPRKITTATRRRAQRKVSDDNSSS